LTCIVGIKENDKIYIAGDCLGSTRRGDRLRRIDRKVFKNGDIMIGVCGSYRARDLLMYTQFPEIAEDLDKYMRTHFVETLRKTFAKGGYQEQKSAVETHASDFLVGIKGKIFAVYGDYQVEESRFPFSSVGHGAPVAMGALHTLHNLKCDLTAREKLRMALDAAAEFDTTVSAPYHFIEG
jgi:ATP-dependent protease HslVU (ClpYQ) peptidase subunit